MDHERKYFVSFFYKNTEGATGFGQTTINFHKKISSKEDITELRRAITEREEFNSIIIINFVELAEDS